MIWAVVSIQRSYHWYRTLHTTMINTRSLQNGLPRVPMEYVPLELRSDPIQQITLHTLGILTSSAKNGSTQLLALSSPEPSSPELLLLPALLPALLLALQVSQGHHLLVSSPR